MSKKTKNPNPDASYEFDLEGSSVDNQEVKELKLAIEALEKKVFSLENTLTVNGLADELDKEVTDEEYICLKGIETIKNLVMNQIQTKDDINMFDILYRNLNTIRGIKSTHIKKQKAKTREELLKIVKGNI